MTETVPVESSAPRIQVRYHLTGSDTEARATAADLCYEQTVEVPPDLVPPGIRERIVGRLEGFRRLPSGAFEAVVSFAEETIGTELPQLLNVLFGNISLRSGIRLAGLDIPNGGLRWLTGPRFGRDGLRARLGGQDRPLLCTALKPMGLSAKELADMAYRFARGGIDIIKDDHGLADQPFCRFEERAIRCAEAVGRANRETGAMSVYMPNVTAPAEVSIQRSLLAKQAGAGGVMICPGLTGWDMVRRLAEDDRLSLPIISHPALLGSFVADHRSGFSHSVLFGRLPRLAGADACIFPSFGGRFAFTRDDCRGILEDAGGGPGRFKPILPIAGGGITLARLPELCDFYGPQVIFLIGGALRRFGPDLAENCRQFRRLVSRPPVGTPG